MMNCISLGNKEYFIVIVIVITRMKSYKERLIGYNFKSKLKDPQMGANVDQLVVSAWLSGGRVTRFPFGPLNVFVYRSGHTSRGMNWDESRL